MNALNASINQPRRSFLEVPGEIHIMVDIETLSTSDRAAITEIGACVVSPFTPSTFDRYFFQHTIDPLGECSVSTMQWRNDNNLPWLVHLSDIDVLDLEEREYHIKRVLPTFFSWMRRIAKEQGDAQIILWCKGTDFDVKILQTAAIERCGIADLPWKYNSVRDLRTLLAIFPQFKIPRDQVKHNGLDDALLQASQLIKIAEHILSLEHAEEILNECE